MSMDKQNIESIVKKEVFRRKAKESGEYYVPVGVSNRHLHLSQEDVEILFGKGHSLTPIKELSQPGQFACSEQVTLVGKKGKMDRIRVLGPTRKETQVEISVTDSFVLGIEPVVRMSGDLEGTPGGTLIGPEGKVELGKGVIVSARHIHISPEEANDYGVKNGEKVRVRKGGERGIVFEEVIIRTGEGHSLDMHIDTDEANAGCIKTGETLIIEKY